MTHGVEEAMGDEDVLFDMDVCIVSANPHVGICCEVKHRIGSRKIVMRIVEEIRLHKVSLPIDTYLFAMGEIVYDRDIVCIHKFIDEMVPYEPRAARDDNSHFIPLICDLYSGTLPI